MKAWFLTKSDRVKAIRRVEENMTGIRSNEFKRDQCIEAFLDPKTWFLVIIQLSANVGNGGVLSVKHTPTHPRHRQKKKKKKNVTDIFCVVPSSDPSSSKA